MWDFVVEYLIVFMALAIGFILGVVGATVAFMPILKSRSREIVRLCRLIDEIERIQSIQPAGFDEHEYRN